ncbi:MAG: UDP-N-acetylglucosamine 1-carboxyvinyltransferase [Burkholderiales bacterium]|nr:UDP-N-acetylglucosamine 1-carboxyvinyltransferase [Burkholderiales bacterium]
MKYFLIENCGPLKGELEVNGAKNSVLVIMISCLLNSGKNKLTNVPMSEDVMQVAKLLEDLGAKVTLDYENNEIYIDTKLVSNYIADPEIIQKMRASILILGPLLARFFKAEVAFPGGDIIGSRPLDLHIKGFIKMGVNFEIDSDKLFAKTDELVGVRYVLDYPSVGATENILMAAVLAKGITRIINCALEPEVLDLVNILKKMGAKISFEYPSTLVVEGVTALFPVEHKIINDRLEAGSLILAAAITGGELILKKAPVLYMDLFISKLEDMGHEIIIKSDEELFFKATKKPKSVNIRTMPYPGFPTDLQAPITSLLCISNGVSSINETVYENRFTHIRELQKMGAQISIDGLIATVRGVDDLYAAEVIGSDIRGAYSLLLAG